MEKLVKRFENINLFYYGSNEPAPGYPKTTREQRYAEECKKVAIAFASFCKTNKVEVVCNSKESTRYLQLEGLFNKFIEEYYGK